MPARPDRSVLLGNDPFRFERTDAAAAESGVSRDTRNVVKRSADA